MSFLFDLFAMTQKIFLQNLKRSIISLQCGHTNFTRILSLNKQEVKTMFGKNSKMNKSAKSAKSAKNVESAKEAKSCGSRASKSETKSCSR